MAQWVPQGQAGLPPFAMMGMGENMGGYPGMHAMPGMGAFMGGMMGLPHLHGGMPMFGGPHSFVPGVGAQYAPSTGMSRPDACPPTEVADRRRKRRKKALEGGPKKPATSFVMFSNERRAQVKTDHPDLTFIDLGKKLGEMWREMDVETRKIYETKAKDAKEKYLEEKKEWLITKDKTA
eukprot:CAMPEP_0173377746 /NCGR_PEP_ID=MMETSP1356-20130122/1034_1 /TAXON_ID=77927 ORGANISM="Hemiselmis virescens, Strain PCC157" /NCGR_SAMPLE_ID=MMETSP1356 /ASSEMBLY_ACC=CAM_ASM_000847 /LENGTH=178 /DNA_ID=CAMNT_0014330615 /DNA_START=59 /DNA_END=595 /DNA_ORIENTATION=+